VGPPLEGEGQDGHGRPSLRTCEGEGGRKGGGRTAKAGASRTGRASRWRRDNAIAARTRALADGLGSDRASDRVGQCRIRKTGMGEELTPVSKALAATGASIEADML